MHRKPVTTLVGLVLAAASVAVLSGCSGLQVRAGSGDVGIAGGAAAAAQSTQQPAPRLTVISPAPWNAPLRVAATSGAFTSVTVTDTASHQPLAGAVDPASGAWVSTGNPDSGATYAVTAVVADGTTTTSLNAAVKVTQQPDSAKIHFGILPGGDAVVGVNAPIVIRFDHKVTRKAAVESALHVASSVPVVGAWHWVNSSELHFRPQTAWPAHIKVQVTFNLDGVQVSDTRWGSRNATANFSIGDAHQTIVDDRTKTFTFKVNGKTMFV